jgi:rod shape-determining protein MreC
VHDSRRTRLVVGVLLAVALALITLDARNSSSPPVRGLRAFGGAVFGSAESVVTGVGRPVTGFFSSMSSASHSRATIGALQHEVVQLRGELSQARVSKADAAQLQQLLQLAGRGRYRIVPAGVVAAGPAYEDAVTISAGSADGIKTGETVLNGAGFVGTVTSVSAHVSTVLLATDGAARVGVRVAPSGQIGLVTGAAESPQDQSTLRLQVFDATAVLQPGEQVVTFGGWPYAPGVPIGVITRVAAGVGTLTKVAYVRPYVSDGSLGVVGVVVTPPRHNPLFSVLPPRPRATPSAVPGKTAKPHPSASATGG